VSDLGGFAKKMKAKAKAVSPNLNANIKRLVALIAQTVIIATPVKTGHARANWQVGIEDEPVDELDEEDKSGQSTLNAAKAKVAGRAPGQTIFVTNNVPYIAALNDGSSAQAPAQFVEKAIDTAVRAFGNMKVVDK
jgi:hypothetical protein